jgi:broad specificity phosphatase PhoE
MRLALVRHAQRNLGMGSDDEGLSIQGRAQSEALARYFTKDWSAVHPKVMSSPKRRCQQTAAPVAKALGLAVETLPALDECLANESSIDFEERVAKIIAQIRGGTWGDQVVVVSHSDWLEWASLLLCQHLDALERATLKLDNAALHLLNLDGETITFLKKNFRPELT